ncbi:hypothetical protein A7K94_0206555, partial [Modestobacter sp. VKM Ac-2676]
MRQTPAGGALAGAVVQRQPGLHQRGGDLHHQSHQLVLVGQRAVPLRGEPVELDAQVGQPRLLPPAAAGAAAGRRP